MGGALTVPGNVTPGAEANIMQDPEAADAILRSGVETTMIGLTSRISGAHAARHRAMAAAGHRGG